MYIATMKSGFCLSLLLVKTDFVLWNEVRDIRNGFVAILEEDGSDAITIYVSFRSPQEGRSCCSSYVKFGVLLLFTSHLLLLCLLP